MSMNRACEMIGKVYEDPAKTKPIPRKSITMCHDAPKPHDQLFLERNTTGNMLTLVHKALIDEVSHFRVK